MEEQINFRLISLHKNNFCDICVYMLTESHLYPSISKKHKKINIFLCFWNIIKGSKDSIILLSQYSQYD